MMYGLIGKTLKHSFSKDIHEKLGYGYELLELAPEELDDFFKKRDFKGINVTIPYKESVIKYLDETDDGVKTIGACNTIVNKNGRLFGYNTDYTAAKSLIARQNVPIKGKKALILGTGGTSKTYYHALKALGAAEIYKVSRTPHENEISYEEAYEKHSDAGIIANTTPVGMFPNTNAAPIDITRFTKLSLTVDAIYNPLRTEFVLNSQKRGIVSCGGLYMLAAQGVYAAEHFGKCKADENTIGGIYSSLLRGKRNIVFIGMPSAGKSTIARLLDKNFFDTDLEIQKQTGASPKEIIEEWDEAGFRKKESEIIERLSLKNGLVVATGGGAVLDEKNVINLKKNGIIIYLDAPLERLAATEDRPLSKNPELLKKLYDQRKDIYCAAADVIINADGSIDGTLSKVKEALK